MFNSKYKKEWNHGSRTADTKLIIIIFKLLFTVVLEIITVKIIISIAYVLVILTIIKF